MAPEALLNLVRTAGVPFQSDLISVLSRGEPNAVHWATAWLLTDGGSVWTTNADELVERALELIGPRRQEIGVTSAPD